MACARAFIVWYHRTNSLINLRKYLCRISNVLEYKWCHTIFHPSHPSSTMPETLPRYRFRREGDARDPLGHCVLSTVRMVDHRQNNISLSCRESELSAQHSRWRWNVFTPPKGGLKSIFFMKDRFILEEPSGSISIPMLQRLWAITLNGSILPVSILLGTSKYVNESEGANTPSIFDTAVVLVKASMSGTYGSSQRSDLHKSRSLE